MTEEKNRTDKTWDFLKKLQIVAMIPMIPLVCFFMMRFVGSVDELSNTMQAVQIEIKTGKAQQMEKIDGIIILVNKHDDRIFNLETQVNINQVDIGLWKYGKKRPTK